MQTSKPSLSSRLDRLIAAAESHGGLLCGLLLATIAADLAMQAYGRVLWFDELFTFYIAKLDVATIWRALAAGADGHPPFHYVMTRLSHTLFGASELSSRLPAIVSFITALGFLYRYVSRSYGFWCGLVSIAVCCFSGAYPYGQEGRPYAIVLACCSMAIWFWSKATSDRRRPFHFVALAASLIVAIASHYYGVLLLVPFGIGEIVRIAKRRKLDWAMIAALTIPAASIALYLPLMHAQGEFRTGFWSPISHFSLTDFYRRMFGGHKQLALAAALVCAGTWLYEWRSWTRREALFTAAPTTSVYPPHEVAALLALLLLPIPAYLVGALYTQAFVPRYVLATVLGFSALVPAALYAILKPSVKWKPALAVLLVACFGRVQVEPDLRQFLLSGPAKLSSGIDRLLHGKVDESPSLPIVVTPPLYYPVIFHYSSPEIRKRLVYLADPAFALQYTGMNTSDMNLSHIRAWTNFRVEAYEPFLAQNPEFFLFHVVTYEWISEELLADGKKLTPLDRDDRLHLLWCCN